MWSTKSITFKGFKPLPSLSASLDEFAADLHRSAPHHSGFSGEIEKKADEYFVHIKLETSSQTLEQKVSSKNLYEAIYFAFQALFAKVLETQEYQMQAKPLKYFKGKVPSDKKYKIAQ